MLTAGAALAAALTLAGAASAQTAPPPSAAQSVKAAAQAVARPPSAAPVPAAPQSGGPPPAPGAAATAAAAAPAAAPSGGALLVPGSGFRYDPTGRRDPFKSLLQLEKKQRDVTSLPPIQQFDLETVKVVGIIVDPGRTPQAMIKAANGQTFVIRPGTIVGKNEGEVVEISMKGIRVVEKYVDFMNRETRKETFLKSHPAAVR